MVLGSPHNLKSNFHNVWSPRWHELWLPNETEPLQREEWRHVHHNPGEDLGEASAGGSCHCCRGRLTAEISVTLPRDTGHQAALRFAAATGTTPIAGCSLLEPSLFRTRQLSGSCDFQWLLIPRLTASLSQRHLLVTCPLLPRVMKTLPCAMRTLPSPAPARELPQRVWCAGYRPRKFCRGLAPSACPWEAVHNVLLPQRSWTAGRGRAGCVTRRDFRVNGLLQLPDLLLCVLSHSVMSNSATPWTVACQASVSMGMLQARTQEWVAMPSSRGSSQPRDQTQVSRIAGRFFTIWASREAHSEVSGGSEGTGPCHDYSASSGRWSPQPVAQNGFVAPIAKATEWAGTTTEWS